MLVKLTAALAVIVASVIADGSPSLRGQESWSSKDTKFNDAKAFDSIPPRYKRPARNHHHHPHPSPPSPAAAFNKIPPGHKRRHPRRHPPSPQAVAIDSISLSGFPNALNVEGKIKDTKELKDAKVLATQ